MESLDRTATNVIKDVLDRQPLTEAKIVFAWSVAAGPALARAVTVTWADGVLTIAAKSEAWHREVERARPLILGRLRNLIGAEALREIRFPSPVTASRGGAHLFTPRSNTSSFGGKPAPARRPR